jgi:hypothetical protein
MIIAVKERTCQRIAVLSHELTTHSTKAKPRKIIPEC